ncbi:hypothetical protein ATE92_0589 [Ulvibacter sp. MAR_2010_11]|uniref:hypothetical protein n=1 Tax=Ulvibacter sp. MAR_2010_11 TaxID=1250229 RepID=UPI000C2B7F94|nr:hypothetical protein [Ulvibacter sp. MAR_2010_11]PKA82459.1 hypothetical protein ATE92_0589 [Ulvibacter sp. MAR_2010_11]
MRNKTSLLLKILAILFLVWVAISISLNFLLKSKLQDALEKASTAERSVSYEHINVHWWNGSVSLDNIQLSFKEKDSVATHTRINVPKTSIDHLSYWDYLFNDAINFNQIIFDNPNIVHYKNARTIDSVPPSVEILQRTFGIESFQINNGRLTILERKKDSLVMVAENISVSIKNVAITGETLANNVPFNFSEYTIKSDSIFVKIGLYENLSAKNISINNRVAGCTNILMETKMSRSQLTQSIGKERDHFYLTVDSLSLLQPDFGLSSPQFYLKSALLRLSNPHLDIYRNKLVADDLKIKPMYSEMLRNLPFPLTLDSVAIGKAGIHYTEKVKEDTQGGTIQFSEIDAGLSNVSNTYSAPTKTNIDIKALFMKNTPFHVAWNFDVNDPADTFIFKATIGKLAAEKLNTFTEPNLRVLLEGEADKTFFTVSGDKNMSHVDLKIKYDEFKVSVVNEDGRRKKWLTSMLANIIIKKNSDNDGDPFRHGNGEIVRTKNKSFFNYIWLNAEKGLKSAVTGGDR